MADRENITTVRKSLDRLGFNWEGGLVIFHTLSSDEGGWSVSPGWAYQEDIKEVIALNSWEYHELLDEKFGVGFGSTECPRFVAYDNKKIYFPAQYDGATWVEYVWKDATAYMGADFNMTPYPGGG